MEYPINLSDGQVIAGVESIETLNRIDEDTLNAISTLSVEFEDGIEVKLESGIVLYEENSADYENDNIEYLSVPEYEMISEYDLDISFFEYGVATTHDLIEFLLLETIELTSFVFGVTISTNNKMIERILVEVNRYGYEIAFNAHWLGSKTTVSTTNIQHLMKMIMGPINKKRNEW